MYIPQNSCNGKLKSRKQAQKINDIKFSKPARFDKLHASEKGKMEEILFFSLKFLLLTN